MHEENYKNGYLIALLSYVTWGIFPILFKTLISVDPITIMVHRIIWSVIFCLILLNFSKDKKDIKIINFKYIFILLITGLLISCNWLTYIFAINNNQILETSLGYYLNPIVIVLLGMIFLKEKLRLLQIISILIATLGILVQLYNINHFPWISIIIAFSFGFYGLIRKIIKIPALLGLTLETILVLPILLLLLFYMPGIKNNSMEFIQQQDKYFLLILYSCISMLTMTTFNIAVKILPYISLGFMQFITPTISFFIAIFIYHENFSKYYLITFSLIFTALIIYCIDIYKNWKAGN